MTKKEKFIKVIEDVYFSKVDEMSIDPDVITYWNALKGSGQGEEKPKFTDNGKLILSYMKDNMNTTDSWRARDIAEGLFISSRMVSGTIRKLVSDGYVEKLSEENPVVYSLTEDGKNVVIE